MKVPLESPLLTHFQVFLPQRLYFLIKTRHFLTCSTEQCGSGNSARPCAIRAQAIRAQAIASRCGTEQGWLQIRASAPPCKQVKILKASWRKKILAAFVRNIVQDLTGWTAAWEQCLWQSYKLLSKLKGFTRVIQVSSRAYWTAGDDSPRVRKRWLALYLWKRVEYHFLPYLLKKKLSFQLRQWVHRKIIPYLPSASPGSFYRPFVLVSAHLLQEAFFSPLILMNQHFRLQILTLTQIWIQSLQPNCLKLNGLAYIL